MSVLDLSAFNSILERLETVATRLEGAGSGSATASASSVAAACPAAADSPLASTFDAFISANLPPMEAAAKEVGNQDVAEANATIAQAFRLLRGGFAATGVVAKPKDNDWKQIFAPVLELAQEASKKCDNRSDFFPHRKVAAETIGIAYMLMQTSPKGHVSTIFETCDFHMMKVLKRQVPAETAWVKLVKEAFKALMAWCDENCKMGLTWKFNGQDPVQYFIDHPLCGGGGAADCNLPKAPPAAAAAPKASSAAGGGMASMFGAIQGATTGALKKVTADMKTKNRAPEERAAVVPAAKAGGYPAPAAAARPGGKGPRGEPKKELQRDVNWIFENQDGVKDLTLTEDEAGMKNCVNIINCRNAVVHIKCKVKSIQIDGCVKVCVICHDVLSAVELVNSDRIQFQTMGKVNAIAIDKVDGASIYLSKESLGAEINSSKSSDMNVVIPDPDGDELDTIEVPIPEQFTTRICGKSVKTEVSALYSH